MTHQGYLYIATSGSYIQEARLSAKSLRAVDPNAHITLLTNEATDSDGFDQITIRASGDLSDWKDGLAYKVEHIYAGSPYEKTLFLDSDTYFYENSAVIFDLLDYYDVAVAAAPIGEGILTVNGKQFSVYTPYNTGVIAYRKNELNERLFKAWQTSYEQRLHEIKAGLAKGNDQASFMEALLQGQSRVHVFSNLWNARTPKCIALKGRVKIAHGRHRNYVTLGARLNITSEERFWDPYRQRCIVPSRKRSLFSKIVGRYSE